MEAPPGQWRLSDLNSWLALLSGNAYKRKTLDRSLADFQVNLDDVKATDHARVRIMPFFCPVSCAVEQWPDSGFLTFGQVEIRREDSKWPQALDRDSS